MSSTPFFSIIIPTYNRRLLLKETLDSVLVQTFIGYEVILVDNNSTDGTAQMILSEYNSDKIRYICNSANYERGYSRNVGLSIAKGKFTTFLDADDLMKETCLQTVYKFICMNPDARLLKMTHSIYDDKTARITTSKYLPTKNHHKELCKSNFVSCIGVFVHESIYSQVSFNESPTFVGSEDYLVWFRPLALNKLYIIPSDEVMVRNHDRRSVYSNIYNNLGIQLEAILHEISKDELLRSTFWHYKRFIISNYTYHRALHASVMRRMGATVGFIIVAILHNPSLLFSRRAYAPLVTLLRNQCPIRKIF